MFVGFEVHYYGKESDFSLKIIEHGKLVLVILGLFSLCFAFIIGLHLLSFEVKFVAIDGNHAH